MGRFVFSLFRCSQNRATVSRAVSRTIFRRCERGISTISIKGALQNLGDELGIVDHVIQRALDQFKDFAEGYGRV
jgi:hypothetical protein